jgi:tetratricopeptide (TPR) repeat protein
MRLLRPIVLLAALLPGLLPWSLGAEAAVPAYSQALALYKAHKYPDARVAFQDLSTAEPANAKARYYLGRIAMKRNDSADAIAQFERAVSLDPANSDYYAELGGAYGSAAGKASLLDQLSYARKCRAALEKAVELNPDNLDARRGLVDYYRQAPGFLGGGVLKAYAQAEAIKQRDLTLGTLILGQLYNEDHRYDDAINLFKALLRQHPDSYIAHYSIGRIAAESGHHLDEGEEHLQACLKLTPAKDEPSLAAVYWRLGNIAEQRHDPTAARTAYGQALQLDPHFQQAADSLAKLPPATPAK